MGVRVPTFCAVENLSITYSQPSISGFLCIHDSTSMDSTNQRSCGTIGFTTDKKISTYNWTHTVQTPIFQGSTAEEKEMM